MKNGGGGNRVEKEVSREGHHQCMHRDEKQHGECSKGEVVGQRMVTESVRETGRGQITKDLVLIHKLDLIGKLFLEVNKLIL